MMFHGLGNLGDDNSASAIALATPSTISLVTTPTSNPNADLSWCEWCATSPILSGLNPKCWDLNEQICSPIVVQYLKNATPAPPPSQTTIDSQTPDQTINQILQQTQANAVAAATAAAGTQGSYLPSGCDKTDPTTYNPIMCFWNDNQTTIEIIAGLGAALWLLSLYTRR